MKQKTTTEQSASTVCYEMIEAKARERIQSWLQDLLEQEVTEFLGRAKSQRRSEDDVVGYRNGHGKPRRIALSSGTVSVRRPRMRNLGDRFESRVLPLFKRRSQELGELLPRLYLHGLSSGDFELALRGLLGEGAPLAKSLDQSIAALGLAILKSPPHSPMANAVCERVIGTIRRECLDWMIPLSARHLRAILGEWVAHYNRGRPHSALGPGVPD